MDRSVDSIGSCSLDVDADSTDFSDTSGELNFLTPSSAKDIQREFTAGIKERCKLPVINCQAVTTVLDPVTGHISTVLTTTSPQAETATTTAAVPSKKPSYLNLACCVNGYSNLTTYDSKLRQDINKSREVSPNRPIIATLHYNRSEGGNFQLTAPTLSYISMNNTINNNNSNFNSGGRVSNGGGGTMVNGSGTGRFSAVGAGGQDVTDNASMFNGNGFAGIGNGGGLRTKVISSQSQICSVKESERVVKKSFIQQRVEKLYGNAEGVVISKQIHNSNERKYLNNIANENVSKNYAASVHLNGNGNVNNGASVNGTNGVGVIGSSVTKENLDENNKQIGEETDLESLPVLRHLRPEFRAQLQIFSPKKIPKSSPNRSLDGIIGCNRVNGNNNHIFSNGDLSHHNNSHSSLPHVSNGKIITSSNSSSNSSSTNGTSSSILSSSSLVQHQQLLQQQHKSSTRTIAEPASPLLREEHSATTCSSSFRSMETTISTTSFSTSGYHHHQQQQQNSRSTESSPAASSSLPPLSVAVTSPSQLSGNDGDGDAAGPTTVANNSHSSRESRSTNPKSTGLSSVTESVPIEKVEKNTVGGSSATVVEAVESIPVAVVSQQQSEVHSKMKLSSAVEPVVINGDGDGDVKMLPKVIHNGTTTANGTNGHHLTLGGESSEGEEDKENVNGGLVAAKEVTNGKQPIVRDGNYFLQVLKNEQNRLVTMAADIEREVEQLKTDGVDISEEIAGYVLVAAGKARLLSSQKMKQFEGLCYSNLNQTPDEKFQTTCEDLRGFWDMVMLQVDNVDASFREIDTFRRNGWKKPAPVEVVPQVRSTARSTKLLVKRPFKSNPSSASSNGSASSDANKTVIEAKKAAAAAAAAKRDAQRKQLMELKRKQKMTNSSQPEDVAGSIADVEIFVPGASAAVTAKSTESRPVDAS